MPTVISTKYLKDVDRYQVTCSCGHVGPQRITTNQTADDITDHRKECPHVRAS